MALTNIANRLTPSVPIELTFGQAPIATGTKFTTLFGHMAASPGTGIPYQVYRVVNVGVPAAAQAEVDALAGAGSQIGKMVFAFVQENVLGGFGNFPQFRVVMIPSGVSNFGPNQEAIVAISHLRSDMLVSCYPASDSANASTLLAFCTLISGIDKDLAGQFGSFMTLGSLEALAVQEQYDFNSRYVMVASLPDSNTELVNRTGTTVIGSPIVTAMAAAALTPTCTTTSGSAILTVVSSTAGIYPGDAVTGAGIPVGATVQQVTGTTLTISALATVTATLVALSVTHPVATAGVYPGALVTGTGIPANTVVISVTSSTMQLSQSATAAGTGVALAIQNQVSQQPEVVAAVYAAGLMGSGFPYVPMNGILAGGLTAPQKASDWISIDPNGASEQALAAGLSPFIVQPAGSVAFLRTRTTFVTSGSIPATAYFDWQDLVLMNDFREDVFLITQNPPFNGNPGGSKASQQIAQLLLNEIIREAQSYEDAGAFQGVQTLAPLCSVSPSTTSPGRFDFYVPINVIPGLMVIAGNIQGVSTIGNFSL